MTGADKRRLRRRNAGPCEAAVGHGERRLGQAGDSRAYNRCPVLGDRPSGHSGQRVGNDDELDRRRHTGVAAEVSRRGADGDGGRAAWRYRRQLVRRGGVGRHDAAVGGACTRATAMSSCADTAIGIVSPSMTVAPLAGAVIATVGAMPSRSSI